MLRDTTHYTHLHVNKQKQSLLGQTPVRQLGLAASSQSGRGFDPNGRKKNNQQSKKSIPMQFEPLEVRETPHTKSCKQAPAGLLNCMPILMITYSWQSILMDFLRPFPLCQVTLPVHLIPIATTVKVSELMWIYIREIVQLHGVAKSIVSNHNSKFTSAFWKKVHGLLDT